MRGVALRGLVWLGGRAEPLDGTVIVAPDGLVAAVGPADRIEVPEGVRLLGGPGCWVGPGLVDAHVHLAFGGVDEARAHGVVGMRDLGAPWEDALRWRGPGVAVAGPILTAPGGYPSRSWGAGGFAEFADSPQTARALVARRARDGVDVVKLALEPGDGWPVPRPEVLRAVVVASHDAGLAVVAHALTAPMVARALDAEVDELAHTPVEPLGERLVDRIAEAGVAVVSTLQTFFSVGQGRHAAANAAALHQAGVVLRYGTDLGNAGTRPGVDPRELDRLASAGLGRLGALRAATEVSAAAPGVRRRTGRIVPNQPAHLVLLTADPLIEPGAWRHPLAVLCDGRLILP